MHINIIFLKTGNKFIIENHYQSLERCNKLKKIIVETEIKGLDLI